MTSKKYLKEGILTQLKVSLENIIPLTEARDHFSRIVSEVQRDKLYVLTKGGKPAVAIIDIRYLESITGGSINSISVEKEIQKDPAKVGRTPMIAHERSDSVIAHANNQPNQFNPAPKPNFPKPQPNFNQPNPPKANAPLPRPSFLDIPTTPPAKPSFPSTPPATPKDTFSSLPPMPRPPVAPLANNANPVPSVKINFEPENSKPVTPPSSSLTFPDSANDKTSDSNPATPLAASVGPKPYNPFVSPVASSPLANNSLGSTSSTGFNSTPPGLATPAAQPPKADTGPVGVFTSNPAMPKPATSPLPTPSPSTSTPPSTLPSSSPAASAAPSLTNNANIVADDSIKVDNANSLGEDDRPGSGDDSEDGNGSNQGQVNPPAPKVDDNGEPEDMEI